MIMMMDNYIKGETVVNDPVNPFSDELCHECAIMKVKEGTKIRNIIGYVHRNFQNDNVRRVIFCGIGNACAKAISCSEVFKRENRGTLYQLTKICFQRVEEFWEPQIVGLERLKVNKDVPAIFILVSKDPLEDSGCQSSREVNPNWMKSDSPKKKNKGRSRAQGTFHGKTSENRWKREKKQRNENNTQKRNVEKPSWVVDNSKTE